MAGTVMVRTRKVSSSKPTPTMKPICMAPMMLLKVSPTIDAEDETGRLSGGILGGTKRYP